MVDARSSTRVIEELPSLLYRLELDNKAQVLAHAAGSAQKNFVRLLPGTGCKSSWPRKT